LLAATSLNANGFLFTRASPGNIAEPTQKAIILYDQGREDLILQAKYEGPARDFGWLIPVPGLPEVRQGAMDCFHDLSRLTQEPLWPEEFDERSLLSSDGGASRIKAVEIKTIGAFQVAVFSPQETTSLAKWLATRKFILPKAQQPLLDRYFTNHWYFVAAKVNPNGKGFVLEPGRRTKSPTPPSAGLGRVSGELPPLIISFSSAKCVFPLALSAVTAKKSEVRVFVLSNEPVMGRAIFEKQFQACCREQTEWIRQRPAREKEWYDTPKREQAQLLEYETKMRQFHRPSAFSDPADPQPPLEVMLSLRPKSAPLGPFSETDEDFLGGLDLVKVRETGAKDLPACAMQLPRLIGKSWWLSIQAENFEPEEMCDLEFEPALPMFAEKLHSNEGRILAHWLLPRFGARAVPLVLAGLSNSDLAERRAAASAMARMADPRLVTPWRVC